MPTLFTRGAASAMGFGLFATQAASGFGLWSWGLNTSGQLGLGNITNYSSPKQVGLLTTWSKTSEGRSHTLAIKTDGTLWSWGLNSGTYGAGKLGLGNLTNYSSPKQVGALTNWATVAAGQRFSLATKTDGTLWSWGINSNGGLGLGNTTTYSSPKQVGALTTWATVAAGAGASLAVKTDGTLWSWGANTSGQLGLGNITNYYSPVQVGALTTWSKVALNYNSAKAIKTNGTFWSWGVNTYGQLGLNSSGAGYNFSSPVQVGALTTWSTVAAGANTHTIATKTNGTLWSWGEGAYGKLGLGNITNYSSPKQVGLLTTWSTVAAGANHSVATKTDGTLWSWGRGSSYGALGLGNLTNYSSPKQVGALTTWSTVAAGGYSTLATKP